MTDRPFSGRDLLFGAGAAGIAGLAGCAHDASSFLSGTPSSMARVSHTPCGHKRAHTVAPKGGERLAHCPDCLVFFKK